MIKILFPSISRFCSFKYYKDIAKFLKINLPPINQQINFLPQENCHLLGYRKIISMEQATESIKTQIIKDQNSREEMKFDEIKKFASQLQLDVCIINEEDKEVTLQQIKQQIYRQFYDKYIYKVHTGKKHKEIRVPQHIQFHDLKTKANNIQRLVQKGQKRIKLYTFNLSSKSQIALRKLLEILGRKDQGIEEQEIKDNNVTITRFCVELGYNQKSKFNPSLIDKKWKKRVLDTEKKKKFKSRLHQIPFELQDIEIQRQMIDQMRKQNIPLPPVYAEYQKAINLLDQGQDVFLKSIMEEMQQQESEQEQVLDEADINLRQKKYRQATRTRTVQEILEDMEQLKKSSYEMSAFQKFKYDKLQQQLKFALSQANPRQNL